MLRIVACALRDEKGIIYTMERPARHGDIMHAHGGLAECEQGFLTSEGRFACRADARMIAKYAGQIAQRCDGDEYLLFSENLW